MCCLENAYFLRMYPVRFRCVVSLLSQCQEAAGGEGAQIGGCRREHEERDGKV